MAVRYVIATIICLAFGAFILFLLTRNINQTLVFDFPEKANIIIVDQFYYRNANFHSNNISQILKNKELTSIVVGRYGSYDSRELFVLGTTDNETTYSATESFGCFGISSIDAIKKIPGNNKVLVMLGKDYAIVVIFSMVSLFLAWILFGITLSWRREF